MGQLFEGYNRRSSTRSSGGSDPFFLMNLRVALRLRRWPEIQESVKKDVALVMRLSQKEERNDFF